MKFILQEYDRHSLHAGLKAPQDAAKILASVGYKPLYVNVPECRYVRIWRLRQKWVLYLLGLRIRKSDEVIMQWPYYHFEDCESLFRILRKSNCKLTIFIHDLNSLRHYSNSEYWDFQFCNLAERVIAHTQNMRSYLVEKGVEEKKIKILTAFDYLVKVENKQQRKKSFQIVFAGNLSKSPFLRHLPIKGSSLVWNCYGVYQEPLSCGINYKGKFSPDDVSLLMGSWGLVWDGPSLECCTGDVGEYLRYNSPHKLSLYLVSGLPLIVWSQSGLASYVEQNGLGILVDSIFDIQKKIESLSEAEYIQMVENVKSESEKLKAGSHLKTILQR